LNYLFRPKVVDKLELEDVLKKCMENVVFLDDLGVMRLPNKK
jgi:hypothetical protein